MRDSRAPKTDRENRRLPSRPNGGTLACPVRVSTRRVTSQSRDLKRALRRLREDLRACRRCQRAASCSFLKAFNAQVDQAIAEVVEEWEAGISPPGAETDE